jgi:hypothetical protein
MKHIRLFEGFNTDDYYQHIDSNDWWDNRYERIEMSYNTIKKICGLFSNWNIEVDDNMYIIKNNMISTDNQNVSIKNYDYTINLYEVDDEYFYVNVTRRYPNGESFEYSYKCDQLEGVIKFLKNENII